MAYQSYMDNALGFKKNAIYDFEYYIIGFILFSLPFAQALTINILFPLKIYEILIVFYFLIKPKAFVNIPSTFIFKVLLFFLFFTLISINYNLFKSYPYRLDSSGYRVSQSVDSFLKFAYVMLAYGFFVSYYNFVKRRGHATINFFFKGVIVACFYCWYLFFSGLLHLPILKLPGMEEVPQTLDTSFGSFVRCGTFKEGNFMGLFLVISGGLAFFFDKKKLGYFFFATIITTFSTSAILCVMLFFFIIAIRRNRKNIAKLVGVTFSLVTLVFLLSVFSEGFRTIVVNKLFVDESSIENSNDIYSRLDRINTTVIGLTLFEQNPLFGVGLNNYGLHFKQFNSFDVNNLDEDSRRIANNVYVEVLCETGVLASLCFLCFLIYLLIKSKSNEFIYLNTTYIVTLIYIFAYPTFTILYLWFFLSILTSEIYRFKTNSSIAKIK